MVIPVSVISVAHIGVTTLVLESHIHDRPVGFEFGEDVAYPVRVEVIAAKELASLGAVPEIVDKDFTAVLST